MGMLNITDLLVSNIHHRNFEALAATRHLSSGIRIEAAVDDPAGLSLLSSLKSEERGIIAAIDNVADTISMVDVIDGYLSNTTDMLFRIRDLAVQASNEAVLNGCEDRSKFAKEVDSLIEEIERQAKTGFFVGKKVLQGNLLAKIEADLSTAVLLNANTATAPSWVDNDTILFTGEVDDTGAQTGSRPSANGADVTTRVLNRTINADNSVAGGTVQMTKDPKVLSDFDGDTYFDFSGGSINDPLNGPAPASNNLFPLGDPDVDGDGYPSFVDNDDTDATETGTGLQPADLAADVTIAFAAPPVSAWDPTIATWNNSVERSFAAANVDRITVNVGNGDYTVQVYDTVGGAWHDEGTGTGAGADVEFVFSTEYMSDKVRVVLDDPVVKADGGNVTIAPVTGEISNIVELNAQVNDSPPFTYGYAITGPVQDVDTIEIQVTGGVAYDIYADDGTGPSLVTSSVGTGALENLTGFGTVSGPTTFYVELAAGGAVAGFDPYLDASKTLGAQTPDTPPLTYSYAVTGVPQNIDTIDIQVTAGVAFDIYSDDGTGPVLATSNVGTGGVQSFAVGPIANPTSFHVELAAAGAASNFDAYLDTDKTLGAQTASVPAFSYSGPAQDVNTIEIQVSAGVAYDIYSDDGTGPALVTSSVGTGAVQTFNGFGTKSNVTDLYVELAAAGAVSNFATKNITNVALGAAAPSTPPFVEKYTINAGPQNIDNLDITATQNYDVYVDGNFIGSGLAGGPTSFGFASTNASEVTIEMGVAGAVTQMDATLLAAPVGTTAAGAEPRYFDYNFAAANVSHLEIETAAGIGYTVKVDGVAKGVGVGGSLETFDFASVVGATQVTIEMDPGAGAADVVSIAGSNIATQALGAQADATRKFTYSVTDINKDVTHIDLNVTAGENYTIYDDLGGVITAGVGTGAVQNLDLGGTYNTTFLEIDLDISATTADIASFAARNLTKPGTGAQTPETRFFKYNVTDASKDVTHVDLNIAAGVDYKIYDDAAGLIGSGTGTGAAQEVDLGGTVTTNFLRLELVDQGNTSADINSFAARNETHQTLGAQADKTRFFRYDVQGAAEIVSHLDVEVTNGVAYKVYDDTGATIYNGTGTGAVQSIDLAAATAATANLRVEVEVGATSADVVSFDASNEITLAAASNGFVDLNGDNDNVITYSLDNSPGLAHQEFDRLEYTILSGHDYEIYYFDNVATSWTFLKSGVGTGALETYQIEDDASSAEIKTDQIQIRLLSGNDTQGGEADLSAVINRIDRDGDLFPDSIEDFNGSNPDGPQLPFGAVGGPDDDMDGFLDAPALYDPADNGDIAASTNPYGYTWTNGSGNTLDVSGGQYDPLGALNDIPDELLPSSIDTDGDTLPDPLDPFPNQAEFTTWVDQEAAYKGGNLIFVSNRATPDNTAQRDLYLLSGGVYQRVTTTDNVYNPALSQDGSAAAWENNGVIEGYFQATDCGGTSTVNQVLVNTGLNPTWSPDESQITFDDGAGRIFVADIVKGAPASMIRQVNVTGEKPDWSPDGDTLLYIRADKAYAYNFVTEREYDLKLDAKEISWSPDGTRIAYLGTDDKAYVATLDIEYDAPDIQVGGNNSANNRMEFDLPDMRASALGLTGINMHPVTGPPAAIDIADSAIDKVNQYRVNVGSLRNRLTAVINDLNNQRVNAAASRSSIEDTDMASEYTTYAANMIRKDAALATAAQATGMLKSHYRNLIDTNVQNRSLGAMYGNGWR